MKTQNLRFILFIFKLGTGLIFMYNCDFKLQYAYPEGSIRSV